LDNELKKTFILFLILLLTPKIFASMGICEARQSALNYVLNQQTRSETEVYQKGEWASQVTLGGIGHSLGLLKDGPFEDANIFTTASIHNVLAEIYLKYNKDPRLTEALYSAIGSMNRYVTDKGSYDFWPRNPGLHGDIHMPHFIITNPSIEGMLAIPADADDTAVVELTRLTDHLVCLSERGAGAQCPPLNPHVDQLFTPYTDDARFPAPSNLFRAEISTGAYLTWLQREPLIPWLFHAIGAKENGSRIVLDKNDVDCVVNANVLRTLTLHGKKDAKGYAQACSLLLSNAEDEDFNSCGDYYPDTYWYHYAVARAYVDGADCLKPAALLAIRHILAHQEKDGRWKNQVIAGDDILATAFAVGAVLKIGNPLEPSEQAAIRKGIAFLLSAVKKNRDGFTYWPGGVFFSAGVPARTGVLWYSDSFTTSIITLLLYDAQAWLPEAKACR
jgi:hypothetical protein